MPLLDNVAPDQSTTSMQSDLEIIYTPSADNYLPHFNSRCRSWSVCAEVQTDLELHLFVYI